MSFLLQDILLEPRKILGLEASEYGQLISQGRNTVLLASLASALEAKGLLEQIPSPVRRHFQSAMLHQAKQKHDLDYDANKIREALNSIDTRLILLKGGAYLQAELPVGQGRLLSDIDILVPQDRIAEAELALNASGWECSQLDPYNERYYREWMHEIPPLFNKRRQTTLDVHHTILPPTAKAAVNASLLFEDLIEVKPGIYTLSLQDMVIHSATHLFHEGEFNHGLRDIWDLHQMLRDFPTLDTTFWEGLVGRARELDLLSPLYHALNYSQRMFRTPLPPSVIEEAGSLARRVRKPLMDFLYLRAFRPNQPECRLPLTQQALLALYIRSHYLKMPLHVLIPHLTRKAWMRRFGERTTLDAENDRVQGEKA